MNTEHRQQIKIKVRLTLKCNHGGACSRTWVPVVVSIHSTCGEDNFFLSQDIIPYWTLESIYHNTHVYVNVQSYLTLLRPHRL